MACAAPSIVGFTYGCGDMIRAPGFGPEHKLFFMCCHFDSETLASLL